MRLLLLLFLFCTFDLLTARGVLELLLTSSMRLLYRDWFSLQVFFIFGLDLVVTVGLTKETFLSGPIFLVISDIICLSFFITFISKFIKSIYVNNEQDHWSLGAVFFLLLSSTSISANCSEALINWITLISFFIPNKITPTTKRNCKTTNPNSDKCSWDEK